MTDLTPIECEARLVGLSKQRRKDGDWIEVKFHIHPDDHPAALFILPLGTDCTLSIKGVTASEKPTTETEAPKPKGGPLSKRAGMLCHEPAFQSWMFNRTWMSNRPWPDLREIDAPSDRAAVFLRFLCKVKSRAELDHNEQAGGAFERIEQSYYDSQRGWSEGASR